jgi:NAD(P)H dehydrogenase (quinone)
MILITGATGHFGRATIDFLLKQNFPAKEIAALVRDETKAADLKAKGIELRKGDYHDYASLVKAFRGIEKLLLISSNDLNDRTGQQINAINAAKEAGVKHVSYTSIQRWEKEESFISIITQSHWDTDKYLKESGLTYTILKNTLYADILPGFLGGNVVENGVNVPAGNGSVPFVTRLDMAEAAANILAGGKHDNKEYAIASEVLYSFADIAKILSDITGKDIKYNDITPALFIEQRVKEGIPQEYAGFNAMFAEAVKQGELAYASSDLTSLLGRKPTSLKEVLQTIYAIKK